MFRRGRRPAFAQRATVGRLSSAFTLVELLVVIVVIAVLAGITLPLSKYAIGRANESRQKVMRAKMISALEEYRSAYGEYPITPPGDPDDVLRHYPVSYATRDTVSSSTNVLFLGTNTQEVIYDIKGSNVASVDYCLTYPLMLKQLEKGSRPFMEFPFVDVAFLVTGTEQENTFKRTIWRRTKTGGWSSKLAEYVYGDAVKRPKAIDPVSGDQWKYVCTNGLNYDLIP